MLRVFVFIAFFWSTTLFSQIFEDFSDGELKSNPEWIGDTANFLVVARQLHLQAPALNDTSIIFIKSNISLEATWQIKVGLDFNPSSSNYCKIYLTAEEKEISKNVSGYFVKLGGSQDEISLYRQDGDSEVKIIDGKDGSLNKNNSLTHLFISRGPNYSWTLSRDTTGGNNFIEEGKVSDSNYVQSLSFGIVCKYTSTRSNKFYFDDVVINGLPYTDTEEPKIINHEIISTYEWIISFSEKLDPNTIKYDYFKLVGKGNLPFTLHYDSVSFKISILSSVPFPHGILLSLFLDSISDLAGNTLKNSVLQDVFNNPDNFSFKDIIFNEIMPDPEPSIGLPESEYIEIYNRSQFHIKLNGWKVFDTKDTGIIEKYILAPSSYLLLVEKKDSSLWNGFNVQKCLITLPSLNNAGDQLYLTSNKNKIIDSVWYLSNQFSNQKIDGGYSLELINPNYICTDTSNWSVSNQKTGGSPGEVNAKMNTQLKSDSLIFNDVLVVNDSIITLSLNGKIKSDYSFLKKVSIEPELEFSCINYNGQQLSIYPIKPPFVNTNYTVTLNHVPDCYEQIIDQLTFSFIYPDKVSEQDLIINEVLFNPYPGGNDFVEIYNKSNSYFDLNRIWMTNEQNDSTADKQRLSEKYKLMPPGQYFAFTKDTSDIHFKYPNCSPKSLITSNIPSFNDDKGYVSITNEVNLVIDEFAYNAKMHFPLLEDPEGVSLERISPIVSSYTKNNWTSASSVSGFATPGQINSQYAVSSISNFKLEPTIFSPDNDGYMDILCITYKFNEAGNTGNIFIYNEVGSLVKKLLSNESLNISGSFFWNGLDDHNQKVPMGYYIVVFEVFNLNGEHTREMASLVVANKLK